MVSSSGYLPDKKEGPLADRVPNHRVWSYSEGGRDKDVVRAIAQAGELAKKANPRCRIAGILKPEWN